MSKILYVSDLLDIDLVGGGELNDAELCLQLVKNNHNVSKIRSHMLTVSQCKDYDFIVVSNFVNMQI